MTATEPKSGVLVTLREMKGYSFDLYLSGDSYFFLLSSVNNSAQCFTLPLASFV